jgi:hypothetical protein
MFSVSPDNSGLSFGQAAQNLSEKCGILIPRAAPGNAPAACPGQSRRAKALSGQGVLAVGTQWMECGAPEKILDYP